MNGMKHLQRLVHLNGRLAGTLLLLAFVETSARAELHFYQPSNDAGEVRTGSKLSHEFRFVNDGNEPLHITDVRGSCGCLRPHLERRAYQPGEDGTLRVEVNTLSQSAGPHHWTVTVRYESEGMLYEVPVALTAQIVNEVSVQPASVTVYADREVGHEILLTDLRPTPLQIMDVRSSSPGLRTQIVEVYRDDAGRQVRKLRVEVGQDYPEGRHDEIVDIYTDDPHYRELKVPVTIIKQARQRISVTPREVALLVQSNKPAPVQMVLLRDVDNQPISVEEVRTDSDAVSCQWTPGSSEIVTLKIQVDTTKITGDFLQTSVEVHLSGSTSEVVKVPLTYMVK